MLVLPMSRVLANLMLGSMRKMNLVLVALNLGSRGFGKLGDGRRRRDLCLFLPPGFRRRCFLVVYQARLYTHHHHHREPSLLHASSNHVGTLQTNLNQSKNFPASRPSSMLYHYAPPFPTRVWSSSTTDYRILVRPSRTPIRPSPPPHIHINYHARTHDILSYHDSCL